MEHSLKELGLSEYEIKCYLALIRYGSQTGGVLSKSSTVPQGKIYSILHKLIDRGLVSMISQNPKVFTAIDPQISIKNIIEEKKNAITGLEELPMQLKKIKTIHKSETDEKITILRGKKNAFPIAYHIYSTAQKSLDVMLTFELLTLQSKKLLLDALQKNIKIRILATKKDNLPLIHEMRKLGFDVRYYPVDELRLLIKDDSECLQSIVNPKDLADRTNVYIQSRELTKALKLYFNSVWKKAKVV